MTRQSGTVKFALRKPSPVVAPSLLHVEEDMRVGLSDMINRFQMGYTALNRGPQGLPTWVTGVPHCHGHRVDVDLDPETSMNVLHGEVAACSQYTHNMLDTTYGVPRIQLGAPLGGDHASITALHTQYHSAAQEQGCCSHMPYHLSCSIPGA